VAHTRLELKVFHHEINEDAQTSGTLQCSDITARDFMNDYMINGVGAYEPFNFNVPTDMTPAAQYFSWPKTFLYRKT
jgi:hypothetical protein